MFGLPDAKRIRREDLRNWSSDEEDGAESDDEARALLEAKLKAQLSSLVSFDLDLGARQGVSSDSALKPETDAKQVALSSTSGPEPPSPQMKHGEHFPEIKQGAFSQDGKQGVPSPAADINADPDQDPGVSTFQFRLFSTSTDVKPTVVLPSAKAEEATPPPSGRGGFVAPRPLSHYLAGEASQVERERLTHSALTGEQVVRMAGRRNWGLEVPWRVFTVVQPPLVNKAEGDRAGGDSGPPKGKAAEKETGEQHRRRPGKKMRIAIRTKARAKKERAKSEKEKKIGKEEHLKEKKKRLNRQRKLKRREKEREKKRLGVEGDARGLDEGGGKETESDMSVEE